ncbi:MAG: hypothetical protein ACJ786_30600 [Catenulispora sp.]
MTPSEQTAADAARLQEISKDYGGNFLAPMMLAVVREAREAWGHTRVEAALTALGAPTAAREEDLLPAMTPRTVTLEFHDVVPDAAGRRRFFAFWAADDLAGVRRGVRGQNFTAEPVTFVQRAGANGHTVQTIGA